ncbi:hypothetical protein P872_11800 [Rhodonellum psychrophilum GCM71 = DSM 17998]|uniref:Glycosyltransferase 61 catalytic domain-containing protein n=2 Tax=Rhodonellum TaxID=336827 RepID=U5BTX8_9BACT|nr:MULTISPECIES: glycosyltransferase family 61 protein [Rhodonellum]ERM80984.1 hypothetical protein P872_11800 [Rhodonellum psychrophilum GCM71 = DSM 17998]SDZ55281.1 Protein of unknown function [Rhodonellum ikkaensis]
MKNKHIIKNSFINIRHVPENFDYNDLSHFKSDLYSINKDIHIKIVCNARVIQRYVYKNGLIQNDYVHTHGVNLKTKIIAFLKPLFNIVEYTIPEGVWVLDTWSKGYFHFLTDLLPRCLTAKEYWENYPILLPSYYLDLNYIKETLQIFPFKIFEFGIYSSFKVKDLIMTSRLRSCAFDPDQIKLVRNFFRMNDEFNLKKDELIYISRKLSSRRKVLNEEELKNFLESKGFKIIIAEKFSFEEQRRLMSKSKLVISNHGAGLTNMLFMPDNSIVVELKANVSTINNCYFNLARALDHKYYYTLNKANSKDVQKADIYVDIKKLDQLLNDLL